MLWSFTFKFYFQSNHEQTFDLIIVKQDYFYFLEKLQKYTPTWNEKHC